MLLAYLHILPIMSSWIASSHLGIIVLHSTVMHHHLQIRLIQRGFHQILPKQFHVHLHTRLSLWIASDDCWLVMIFIPGSLSMSMLGQDLLSLFNPLYDTLFSRGTPRTNWFHRSLQVITSYHPTCIERKAGQHIISTSPGPTKA